MMWIQVAVAVCLSAVVLARPEPPYAADGGPMGFAGMTSYRTRSSGAQQQPSGRYGPPRSAIGGLAPLSGPSPSGRHSGSFRPSSPPGAPGSRYGAPSSFAFGGQSGFQGQGEPFQGFDGQANQQKQHGGFNGFDNQQQPGFQGEDNGFDNHMKPGFQGENNGFDNHQKPGFQGENNGFDNHMKPGFQGENNGFDNHQKPGFHGGNNGFGNHQKPGFQGENNGFGNHQKPGFQGGNNGFGNHQKPGFQGGNNGFGNHQKPGFQGENNGFNGDNFDHQNKAAHGKQQGGSRFAAGFNGHPQKPMGFQKPTPFPFQSGSGPADMNDMGFNGYPSSNRGGLRGGDDDDMSEDAMYSFEYSVEEQDDGPQFGQHEQREGDVTRGSYHVLLPDGRLQKVDYEADENGFRPTVSFEDTRTDSGRGGAQGDGPY